MPSQAAAPHSKMEKIGLKTLWDRERFRGISMRVVEVVKGTTGRTIQRLCLRVFGAFPGAALHRNNPNQSDARTRAGAALYMGGKQRPIVAEPRWCRGSISATPGARMLSGTVLDNKTHLWYQSRTFLGHQNCNTCTLIRAGGNTHNTHGSLWKAGARIRVRNKRSENSDLFPLLWAYYLLFFFNITKSKFFLK